jgi:rSAM/selenodomain-associated transferase 1
MDAILGLFAKWPRAGHVKTRLASARSEAWAAGVAEALLRDAAKRLTQVDARRILVYSPPESVKDFAKLSQADFDLRSQGEGDLGQRLARFFHTAFAEGAQRVVVVGTDSPTLPVALVRTALDELLRADVVLGPATDGGYYLIGCARLAPTLFDEIPWSSAEVLAATVARVRQSALRLAMLPPWYDVDTLDDWHMLRGHLLAMRCAGIDPELPHLEALLDQEGGPPCTFPPC